MVSAISKIKDSKGFVSAWMLGFVFIVLFIGIFFYELGSIYNERQKLVNAVDRAAAAGATAIDEAELINSGDVVLNIDDANERCVSSIEQSIEDSFSGRGSEFVSNPDTCAAQAEVMVVNAQAQLRYGPIFRMFGVESREFNVTAQARPSCSDDEGFLGECLNE